MHPALRRLLADDERARAFWVLADELSGADLTTLLLGVFARRAGVVSAGDVLRSHRRDRFVGPAEVDALALTRIGLAALEAASDRFEPVVLAPVVPFGTHFATGGTPQNNVVSTIRLTEVAADTTNSLALEAADRRAELLAADPRSDTRVRLAATHRVTRAQNFEGPRSFAHFSLLGLVSAGRDRGNYAFEVENVTEQIEALVDVVRAATEAPVEIRLSAFDPDLTGHCRDMIDRLRTDSVSASLDDEREHGRGYYRNLCFKLHVESEGELLEIGDGGDVWWTQSLLGNRKERLTIAGLGLDRLAMIVFDS